MSNMYKHRCIKCDKVKLRGRSFFCRCCNLRLIAVSLLVFGVLVLRGMGLRGGGVETTSNIPHE